MITHLRRIILAIGFCCTLSTLARAAILPAYSITDLSPLSDAAGINTNGQIAGYGGTGATLTTYVYSAGAAQPIGSLGGTQTTASGINDNGMVVGVSATAPGQDLFAGHAFVYSNGVIKDLGTLGGDTSLAWAVNDSGQIVGNADVRYPGGSQSAHAFLYSNGTMTDLGAGDNSYAYGINAAGQIVGSANGNRKAFVYTGGSIHYLGTLGGMDSFASAINNSGQAAGTANTTAGPYHAFFYDGVSMHDLLTLGGPDSFAEGINSQSQIVGYSELAGSTIQKPVDHAFLFSNGQMTDLNSLLPAGSGWSLTEARSINDAGQIVGYGVNPQGQEVAYLLTPVPEPAMTGLLLAMIAGPLLRRRRQLRA